MKPFYTYLIVAILLFCNVSKAQVNLSAGLLAHYPLDGNFLDASGNGNNGTQFGGVSFTSNQAGTPNSAAYFDGIDDFVLINSNSNLSPANNFTIAFKFLTHASKIQVIIAKADYYPTPPNNSANNFQYQVGINAQQYIGNSGLFFATSYNPNNPCVNNSFLASDYAATNILVVPQVWHCVVMTYQNGVKKIYDNGSLITQKTVSGSTSVDNCPSGYLKLGVHWQNDKVLFNGALDEVRVYNRVINQQEIAAYCNNNVIADTSVKIDQVSKSSFCPGETLQIGYSVTSNFSSGNIFTAQLSNTAGSFASPAAIGSIISSASGIITCTIPSGIPAGTGYRIRIVASNPSRTSADNGNNLTVKPFASVTVSPKSSLICIGESVTLSATGATTYNWSPATGLNSTAGASVIATPNIPTQYIVTGSDPSLCDDTDTVTIDLKPHPPVVVAPKFSTICENASVTLTASGAGSYTWSPSTGLNTTSGAVVIASPKTSTYYIVTGSSDAPCKGFDTAFIYVDSARNRFFIIESCIDTVFSFGQQTIGTPGTYTEVFKTVSGCDSTVTINFKRLLSPFADFSHAPIIPVTNGPVTFTNKSYNAINYSWNFGDGEISSERDPIHMYMRSGTYNVCLTAESTDGCEDTACNNAEADVYPVIAVPSAFSPNGDGNNDILWVKGGGVKEFQLKIFNRWGQVIFETTDMAKGWDGIYKGAEQDIDVYAYTLNAVFIDNTTFQKAGNITVIK